MLDLAILGVGGGMPLPGRYLSSTLLNFKGRKILIDCGEGTQVSMRELGWGFKTLDIICITHAHGAVPQNGTPRDTVHLHRRPPPASTGYCSSTVHLLQPPPTTVHPRVLVHPASTARYSTGYCSTTPPPSTVHPALHTTGSCSSTPPWAP